MPLVDKIRDWFLGEQPASETSPLPDSWNVALSLSQTGRQFCDMLVMTAKAKMSKEPALTMNLPDLGPDPN